MATTFALKLRFSGDGVSEHGLRLYDGATSFHGFARALQMTANAYLNDEAKSWATSLRGGALFFGPPQKGSVVIPLFARFSRRPKSAPLNPDAFYDFTEVALKRATGIIDAEAKSHFVKSKLEKDEPFFDELAEKLEGSLIEAHRIVDSDKVTITLERPRSTLVTFDAETSAWVRTRDENPDVEEFRGNMTRFNTKTGNGRAYIKSIGKIIPIRKSDSFNEGSKGFLTWSLHGDNVLADKELKFFARKIESATGQTKRLLLDDCVRI